jgi:AraC-like DNA-binding protein
MNMRLFLRFWLGISLSAIPLQLLAEAPSFRDDSLDYYLSHYQYQQAIQYVQQQLNPARALNPDQQMYYLIRGSRTYHKLINAQEALSFAQEALKLFPQVKDSLRWAEATLALAHASNMEGNLNGSSSLAKQVLGYLQRHPDPDTHRDALYLLAIASSQNSQFDQAMQLFKKAHQITLQHQLNQYWHVDYLGMGMVFMFTQQIDSAFHYLDKAAQAALNVQDKSILCGAYSTMAACYQVKQNFSAWKSYLLKSIAIASEIQHISLLSNAYSQLMEFEMASNNPTQAIRYGLQAKDFLKANPIPLFEVYVDSLLYIAYKKTNNTTLALTHFESYYHNKTAILNKEQASKIDKLTLELDIQDKDLQLAQQHLIIAANKRKTFIFIIGYLVLVALIAIYLIIKWLRKRTLSQFYQKEKTIGQMFNNKSLATHSSPIVIDHILTANDDPGIAQENIETFTEEHRELYDNMIKLIESQKLYLNPKLDQNIIISLLGTNRFYLFQAINKHADFSFRDIINRYRVEEAKRLIQRECQKEEVILIPQIYADAGFNSSSTYYRTFKQFTGLSPMEYAKEYLKDLQA